jgi:site-specific DNA-methyltransferase (adenine-specific)
MKIFNGDCLEEMKALPDKSVDLFICDLPYGETNCKWDTVIDMEQFWVQFKRLRKSKRTACIHFCSTKFGYSLIKSWEKGFKMDMVWKKRNKTGGLASRYRPMRNHEMVYFFYEQSPKYNRDKYHKRINKVKHAKSETTQEKKSDAIENKKVERKAANFEPSNPVSIIDEKYTKEYLDNKQKTVGTGSSEMQGIFSKENLEKWRKENGGFEPPNPASVVEEDEPVTMFESEKVFIGKRNHQTEKPQDILEFFLKYWSDEGDVILDPTMGSGSTGVACKNLNREFIGIELTEKYFEVAKNRLA